MKKTNMKNIKKNTYWIEKFKKKIEKKTFFWEKNYEKDFDILVSDFLVKILVFFLSFSKNKFSTEYIEK